MTDFYPTSGYKLVRSIADPKNAHQGPFDVKVEPHPTDPTLVIGFHQMGGPTSIHHRYFDIVTGLPKREVGQSRFQWRLVKE